MQKTIIASDLHLLKKPGMWSGRAEIAGDDVFALEQIVELCKVHDADLFLLGDVFDSVTNLPRPLAFARDAIAKMPGVTRVFFIQGQHEIVVQAHYENYPWLSLINRTEYMGGKSFGFHGMKAYAMDYFPQAFEALNFAKVPKDVEVLFMHGTIDVAMPMSFHFSGDSLKQFKKLKHVFAGDYHHAMHLTVGNCSLHYCGSTWQISADEPREKSVILLESEKPGDFDLRRIVLKTRQIIKLSEICDKNGMFSLDMLRAVPKYTDMPQELDMPVILVDQPTDKDTYTKLAEFGHIYTTSGANPDMPTQAVIDMAEKMTNEEILANYADREKNPSEFAFTLDVIENSSEDAINRLRDKMGIKAEDRTIQPVSEDINLAEENPEEEEAEVNA